MGARGPDKKYDVKMRVDITHAMDEFLETMSSLMGCTKQEVVRRMIDQAFAWSLAGPIKKED